MNMKTLHLTALLLAISATAAFPQAMKEDFGVKKALETYDAAWSRKDVNATSDLLADGYVYFSSTGELTDRKRTLEFLASPNYNLTFVERSEQTVQAVVGDTWIISSRWKGRGTFGTQKIEDDQRCGMVWVKQKGRWKLLSEHCVQIVSK